MTSKNSINNCENCSVKWKNFEHLTSSELQLVSESSFGTAFKPGEIIVKQGSPSSNALFITAGMAKAFIEGISGKNFLMSIVLPGRLMVGPGAYVNSRYSYTVTALTSVCACFINFDIFRNLVRTNGAFAESLLEDISAKAFNIHKKLIDITQKKMPGRMADALFYFADEIFKSDEFEMLLTRQELGEMTNMSKEGVVRILNSMEESKIIYSDSSRIKILDREKLRRISEKG